MKQRPRIYCTETEEALMWDRWQKGESLTWDLGKKMADHQRFSLDTDNKVYFCDPRNPWQRGSNENTNGLLRQYFPNGMDLSNFHQNRLNAVARRLAVILHRMWIDGTQFRWGTEAARS